MRWLKLFFNQYLTQAHSHIPINYLTDKYWVGQKYGLFHTILQKYLNDPFLPAQ